MAHGLAFWYTATTLQAMIQIIYACTAVNLCNNYCSCTNDTKVHQLVIDCSSYVYLDAKAAYTLNTNCLGKQDVLLDLSNNPFKTLNTYVPGLENVKSLILKNCNLSSIDDYIHSFIAVEFLELSTNQFQLLPSKLSDSIKHLNVSFNQINYIDRTTINSLRNLIILALQHNSLVKLSDGMFDQLLHLQYLDLSFNHLTHIDANVFKLLKSLKFLNVKHNMLLSMPSFLPLLDRLDISFNSIHEISENSKSNIYPIEVIIFSHNPLHCDCKLLWLKELWDRREYIMEHIDLSYDEFVPVCNSPDELFGEAWDLLADSAFTCEQYDLGLLDKTLEDTTDESLDCSKTISLELVNITDQTAHLKLFSDSPYINLFVLEYYIFGHKSDVLTHHLTSEVKEHAINNLKSLSAYVICVRVDSSKNCDICKDCIEVITKEELSDWQLFLDKYYTLDNHLTVLMLWCFGAPLVLIILILICHDCAFLPLLEMFTGQQRGRRKKLHME